MSEARTPLQRVVVVGSGQVGLIAAIALRRALPRSEVVLVAAASDAPGFADIATSALSFTNRFHDRLGLEEERLVAEAGASHRLAVRYLGWGGDGGQGLFTYGEPDAGLRTAFMRDWGGGPKNATTRKHPHALAEILTEAGRFAVPPRDTQTPLSEVDYALRWNGAAYRKLLLGMAQALGVEFGQGRVAAIVPGDQGIASLSVEGAPAIEADLFVDCSGPASQLLSALPEFAWQDWRGTLPTRRVFFAPPGEPMAALEDRISLLPQGWLSEFAGRDGLQVALGTREGVETADVVELLGATPTASLPLSQGRVSEPWIGNAVAIGDATARFEPLGNFALDLAHRQLALLLEMLPGRTIEPLERREFNRRCGLMMDGVRNTLAMHFAAHRARTVFGPADMPSGVARLLDQFERHGRVPFNEEAPLLLQEYASLLGALGFVAGLPVQMRSVSDAEVTEARRAFDRKAREALEFAPGYAQWLFSLERISPATHG